MSNSNDKIAYDFSNLVVREEEVETSVDNSELNLKKMTETPFFDPSDYSNGAIFEGLDYCWSQTFTDIEIHVRLPENMKSKHLKVKITNNSIDVFSNLEDRQILSGQLSEKCKTSDAMWTITEGNKLNICFDKTKEIWWKKLFTHENDIDVSKIDCSRPIDELSDENQAQIHQIEYDEQQKLKGQLTSEQIKQQEMLRKAWNAEGSPFKGQEFDPNIVQFEN